MDSYLFSTEEDQDFATDPSTHSLQLSDLSPDPLYLVPFSWWSEAREQLYSDETEISSVLYNAASFLRRADVFAGEDVSDTEVFLEMKGEKSEEGISEKELALVPEWMFLRALKWHSEMKHAGDFLASEDGTNDLFSLQIRLSFMSETKSLIIRIVLKDNEVGAFNKACSVFCVKSGLLQIWDFSGQTTQLFLNNRKLINDSVLPDEEMFMELQVYGLSCLPMARGILKDEMIGGHCGIGPSSSSLKINGCIDVNSHRVKHESSCSCSCALGLTGLCNLGNTCFMNSAVQCLVHTPKLVDYFLGDFKKDLNLENPLGMNGKLALAFGGLLRKLWAPGTIPAAPRLFKSTIASFAPQFSGYNQHDSQEFLAFLLDGLHEDLNRVRYKPYIEVKEEDGRPDDEVADEHWKNHLRRNDSIIVDLCQGQYRSKLVCPLCKKLSITFDPFMYLSLPLPSTTRRTMTLTILSSNGTALPFPVTVSVPKDGTYMDLVHVLSTTCSLEDDETLLVAEIFGNSILRFLDDPTDSIELDRDNDRLVAYRLPKGSDETRLVVFKHQCEEKSIHGSYPKGFGIPLITRISNFSRGSEIREQFLKLVNPFLMPMDDPSNDDDAQNEVDEDSGMEDVIIDGDTNLDHESEDDSSMGSDFRFHLETKSFLSDPANIVMDEPVPISRYCDPVTVLVSWPQKMIEDYDTALLSVLPEVCNSALVSRNLPESVSLYKCLDAFLKEEPLGPEDMWYCPNCKKHRQAIKKLDLWRLPEILVIHLKRFSYNRFLKNKLDSYVDFPVDDFGLSSNIIHKGRPVSHHYALFAVSNHYGGMGGGHYTAFVQHGQDTWYEFDDSHVFPVTVEQIKTPAAYVLFYRRISDT